MTVIDFINYAGKATEQTLEQLLPQPVGEEAQLYEAMRYSIFAGGKRLRPALFLATLAAFPKQLEGQEKDYLPFAAALEMIHTYSLIHDDLPLMDNDDLRRGKPTCHKVYGEATALLAGDALLTQAFEVMLQPSPRLSAERVLLATQIIAAAAGARGMIAGQQVDINNEGKKPDLELLQYINYRKTGALFTASILSAAYLAGATEEQRLALQTYAEQLGLAFQIVDDILDLTGDEAKLGKHTGSDAKNDKATYASILGVEEAQNKARQAAARALAAILEWGDEARQLRELITFLVERDH
jgi:geranylgeranyl diphosphate synthase type II